MRYKVTVTATAVWEIYVDADSSEEAIDLVGEGEYDPEYNEIVKYINEEVHDVTEVTES